MLRSSNLKGHTKKFRHFIRKYIPAWASAMQNNVRKLFVSINVSETTNS